VLGAGGAARSITVELALAGAQEITIVNRSTERGRYFQPAGQPSGALSTDLFDDQASYELHAEQLDLNEVSQGVVNLIAPRLKQENIQLELALSPSPLQVFTDRILLRQILLSLFNYVLHLRGQPRLTLRTELNRSMSICFRFDADEQWESIQNEERDSLDFASRLSERLPARLDESYPAQDTSGPAEIRLVFALSMPRAVMVMDDQVAAQRMFQRYLSRTNLEVIGVTDPTEGVEMIRKIQPALLILDVMMPRIDGWEVLQNLQLDPETKHIPIIVCSAWGEPELARSLGAVAFLKKPVVQKDLLDLLVRLGLISE
jgi:CheY-like chemotaxis protein